MYYNFLKFSLSPIPTSQHYAPNPTNPTRNYMSFFFSKRVSLFFVTNGSGKGVSSDVLARQWNRMSFIKTLWLHKSITSFPLSGMKSFRDQFNLPLPIEFSHSLSIWFLFDLLQTQTPMAKDTKLQTQTTNSRPRHPWPNKAKHSLFDLPRNPWPKTPSFASHNHEPPQIGWWGRRQEIVVVSCSGRRRLMEWLRRHISSFWYGWGWWCETVLLDSRRQK